MNIKSLKTYVGQHMGLRKPLWATSLMEEAVEQMNLDTYYLKNSITEIIINEFTTS